MVPAQVVVVGGGVGGLAAALALGRAGHRVTVLERDPLPADADAEEAFVAERRGRPAGAPDPRLPRPHRGRAARALPRRARRAARGRRCTTHADDAPTSASPQPGDEDLAVLIVRRTTFEWVLRQAVLGRARRRRSAPTSSVAGLTGRRRPADGIAGRRRRARSTTARRSRPTVVVAADGSARRRCRAWLGASTASRCPRRSTRAGSMYLARWYRLPGGDARRRSTRSSAATSAS